MEPIDYPRERFETIGRRPVLVQERAAVFQVSGIGALDCLQGLLTNDLAKPGPGSLVYGAMLTPKGMIVVDFWVFRLDESLVLVADRRGREPALELFRRQLPPRLARVADWSDDHQILWFLGTAVDPAVSAIGPPPPECRSSRLGGDWPNTAIGRGGARGPFRFVGVGPDAEIGAIGNVVTAAGVERGTRADLLAARVRAGWPTLGQEIDDRTMPAEVGYESIDGVSYTKGCYTGQETVARVHFRGHPNWTLRSVQLAVADQPTAELGPAGKPAVRLRTVLRFEDGSGIGLASVRREVEPGAVIPAAVGDVIVAATEPPYTPLPATHLQ